MNFRLFFIIILVIILAGGADARKFSYRRQLIKKVEIEGNRNFSDNQIKPLMLTKANHWYNIFSRHRLSRLNVETDAIYIKRFYAQRGYLFASVEAAADYYKDDSSKAVVKFQIDEGKLVYVDSVKVEGGRESINSHVPKLLEKIVVREPVNNDAVVAAAQRIRDLYADYGYPLATVRHFYNYSSDSTRADIAFQIAESSCVINGHINIVQEGDSRSKQKAITREMTVSQGELYSRAKNIESQQNLYSTGLYKSVDLKRVGELRYIGSDTAVADLELRVVGRKNNYINYSFGIGQQQYFNAMLSVLQSSISIGTRNLWGFGRKLEFSAKTSHQLAKRDEDVRVIKFKDLFSDLRLKPVTNFVGINYTEPWFLGLRMPLNTGIVYEISTKNPIIDKYYDKLSAEISVLRGIDKYTSLRFAQRFEYVSIRGVSDQEAPILRLEGQNSMRRRFAVYGQRDTRDNIFVTQSGSYSYLSLDYVGHYLGGDFSFIKSEFSWSRYRLIGRENIFATRIRIGALKELGADGRSSTEDRFTLGGAKTIRGFAENRIGPKWTTADSVGANLIGNAKGGRFLILGNIEVRRPLFWRLGGSAFIDAGNVYNEIKTAKFDGIVTSAGLGLQFFTLVGPINFEYGFKLQRKLDLQEGSYHLTILYAF
ncbi:MAG: BamA/TamA family outer membrane protein [candidate division Zixibacteria bacterium]|jgi:outer membrane protein insertion porin family|nr:BamA/TamA family outer membrane protein [candidate division Zixibacteria bacterium]